MAQAIQDDRAGHLGLNGLAVAQTFNLRGDTNVTTAFATPGGAFPAVHPDRPGYPVFLDPIGMQTLLAPNWVGGTAPGPNNPLAIPRVAPGLVYTTTVNNGVPTTVLDNTKIMRWFTLADDLRFGPDGVPPALLERDTTLSYALMFRQPRSSVPNVVEVSVVVYSRRPLTVTGGGSEYAYPANFNPSGNLVTLDSTGLAKPPLRAGSWILDATYKTTKINNTVYGWAHAYFYRVVSVNEIAPNQFEMEVATPLRRWNAAGNGTVIVMDNVVEVIERGTGW